MTKYIQKFNKKLEFNKKQSDKNFVVVGFGPSGMFTALTLARMGLNPIIIEQGKEVDEREKDIKNFFENRTINKYKLPIDKSHWLCYYNKNNYYDDNRLCWLLRYTRLSKQSRCIKICNGIKL